MRSADTHSWSVHVVVMLTQTCRLFSHSRLLLVVIGEASAIFQDGFLRCLELLPPCPPAGIPYPSRGVVPPLKAFLERVPVTQETWKVTVINHPSSPILCGRAGHTLNLSGQPGMACLPLCRHLACVLALSGRGARKGPFNLAHTATHAGLTSKK